MSVFSILILFFIAYLCFKAIGSIWRDAFGGVGTERTRRKNNNEQTYQYDDQQQPRNNSRKKQTRPIEKGEGEYVDFEDV